MWGPLAPLQGAPKSPYDYTPPGLPVFLRGPAVVHPREPALNCLSKFLTFADLHLCLLRLVEGLVGLILSGLCVCVCVHVYVASYKAALALYSENGRVASGFAPAETLACFRSRWSKR